MSKDDRKTVTQGFKLLAGHPVLTRLRDELRGSPRIIPARAQKNLAKIKPKAVSNG
jgi:hypothetical protein